jgi:putative transposase
MNERVKFIAQQLQKEAPFSELCEHAGISRKTGCKWVERYEAGGVAALVDRSRAPRSDPHPVSSAVVEMIVATRRRNPPWDARAPRGPGISRRPGAGSPRAASLTSCGSR